MIRIHHGLTMKLEKVLTKKNEIFEQYIVNGKSQNDYAQLQLISNSLTETIRSFKQKLYYKLSTKLGNPSRHQTLAKKFQ